MLAQGKVSISARRISRARALPIGFFGTAKLAEQIKALTRLGTAFCLLDASCNSKAWEGCNPIRAERKWADQIRFQQHVLESKWGRSL